MGSEGECLSEKYVYNKALILWKYAKDHLWSANLNCVKNRKTWCPWCAVDNRRSRTIEDMKKFAEKKEGLCLTNKNIAQEQGGKCLQNMLIQLLQCFGDMPKVMNGLQLLSNKNMLTVCW
ncbi:unnamed protein product [Rhizophagus irregularis]|uniref:Uncharacterized protein n=1 Tax=Rhizophagus irregularis TaxID=588596 RepID=A0A915YVD5_9GLOM|nr:unnamed protein product [Rhizophagus irregularis]CAB5346991.1 unnamed protein product [Rhizophagus irregularis]